MEQAGLQAGVPVECRRYSPSSFKFQADSSVDAVIMTNQMAVLAESGKLQQCFSEVQRVLKPGGRFIFLQRLSGAALQPLLQGAGRGIGAEKSYFFYCYIHVLNSSNTAVY